MPIEGTVYGDGSGNLEAVIILTIRGFNGQQVDVPFAIDTGFSGEISLDKEQIDTLGLLPTSEVETTLADGSLSVAEVYTAILVWDEIERLVMVIGQEATPLVGMALLRGYNLSVDAVVNGAVRIARL